MVSNTFSLNKDISLELQYYEVRKFLDQFDIYEDKSTYINTETLQSMLIVLEGQSDLKNESAEHFGRLTRLENMYQNSPDYNSDRIMSLFIELKTIEQPDDYFRSLCISNSIPFQASASYNLLMKDKQQPEFSFMWGIKQLSYLPRKEKFDSERFLKLTNQTIKVIFDNSLLYIHKSNPIEMDMEGVETMLIHNPLIELIKESPEHVISSQVFKLLINAKADVNYKYTQRMPESPQSSTLLQMATQIGSLPMLKTIIEVGADLFVLNDKGKTASQMAKELDFINENAEKADLLELAMRTFVVKSLNELGSYLPRVLCNLVLEYVTNLEYNPLQYFPSKTPKSEFRSMILLDNVTKK